MGTRFIPAVAAVLFGLLAVPAAEEPVGPDWPGLVKQYLSGPKEVRGDGLGRVAAVFDPTLRTDVLLPLVRELPESHATLVRLAKKDLGLDAAPWCAWIEALDEKHGRSAGASAAKPDQPERDDPTALRRFYGIPIPKGEFVFLIDISLSMKQKFEGVSRLARVKQDVIEVIESFEETRRFNVIFFASKTRAFRPRLQPATAKMRGRAVDFVRRTRAQGQTNLEAGLRAALRDPEVKEIILLSDGSPNQGSVRSAEGLMIWLRGRKVRIHTVATRLLKAIAKRTGGEFRTLE